MQTSRCPNCNSDVIIEDDLAENDLVSCANCQSELEIVKKNPLQLASLESNSGASDADNNFGQNQDDLDEE